MPRTMDMRSLTTRLISTFRCGRRSSAWQVRKPLRPRGQLADTALILGFVALRYHWLRMIIHNVADDVWDRSPDGIEGRQVARTKRLDSARAVLHWHICQGENVQVWDMAQTMAPDLALFVLATDLRLGPDALPTAEFESDLAVLRRALEVSHALAFDGAPQRAFRTRFLGRWTALLRQIRAAHLADAELATQADFQPAQAQDVEFARYVDEAWRRSGAPLAYGGMEQEHASFTQHARAEAGARLEGSVQPDDFLS